jgi:site-specific recombinase XerD
MATTPSAPISPLRQRMLHDMMMRGLSPRTQHQYVRNVQRFAAFLKRPPDTATSENLRNFQIYQHVAGASVLTVNCTVSTLRFL